MSVISMKQLLEAGVHFGHQTRRWDPKMAPYIYTARNDIHVINLEKTCGLIDEAYNYIKNAAQEGKTILFVGTKKQAQEAVKEEATRCGMFYINNRWPGGTLTNFKTIKSRIARLHDLRNMEATGEFEYLPKKEVAKLKLELEKLEKDFGGIAEMTKLPDVIFVVDSKKEHICVAEAKKLGIPVVGLIDTNCNPDMVNVIIPGNDDAIRSVKLITAAMADAVMEAKEGVSNEEAPAQDAEEITSMEEAIEKVEEAKQAKKTTRKTAKKEEVKEEAQEEAKTETQE